MFNKGAFKVVIAAAGVGLVSAQLSGLSSQCQTTLTSIVISPSSTCLNAQALVGLVTTQANTSLISPINNWLTGLCGQPACSNDTLTTLVSNVTTGCSSDLQSLGIGNFSTEEITNVVLQAYPTVRKIACLTDANNSNGLCVTETLTNIQNATGTTLSVNGVETMYTGLMSGVIPNVSSSVLCTDCTKQALNIVNTDFPGLINSNALSQVSSFCGADFVNGAAPSGVSQSANNGTNSVGAASFAVATSPMSVAGMLLSSLVALGSGIAVLA